VTGTVTSDDDLMRAARSGSREAFEALFERYRTLIWRFFRRRTPDAEVAAELSQDVFVALIQRARQYEPRGSFRSYLFGIAFNVLLAWRRKSGRTSAWPVDFDPPGETPDLSAVLWVRQALAELDESDREILMLREYEALRYDEIAAALDLPLTTVRTRLFRARLALKAKLETHREVQGVHP
jgi:RNA polymerase sigma-70 factor (ECF subfamily)